MRDDHLGNIELGVRPALGLGLAAFMPLMALFAPVIVLGLLGILLLAFVKWTWAAAMLPLVADDVLMDDALLDRFGANGAIWGAVAMLAVPYLVVTAAGFTLKGWRLFNPVLLAALSVGWLAMTVGAGAVNGTHYFSQVAHKWSHPSDSATRAWNCKASLASGKAEAPGRYSLMECTRYVDAADTRAACRQVMRSMKPLDGPTVWCSGPIREITGHEWPVVGWKYEEWYTGFRKPVRNKPLATPERMRAILAKEGLTPRP